MLLEVQAVNHLSCHLSYMDITKRDCSMQKLTHEARLPWKKVFVVSYLFIFFVLFNSKGFNPERDAYMCTYIILYEYLAAAQKQQQLATSSSVFL